MDALLIYLVSAQIQTRAHIHTRSARLSRLGESTECDMRSRGELKSDRVEVEISENSSPLSRSLENLRNVWKVVYKPREIAHTKWWLSDGNLRV